MTRTQKTTGADEAIALLEAIKEPYFAWEERVANTDISEEDKHDAAMVAITRLLVVAQSMRPEFMVNKDKLEAIEKLRMAHLDDILKEAEKLTMKN